MLLCMIVALNILNLVHTSH